MEGESELLRNASALEESGVVLLYEGGQRGRLVHRLSEIPSGFPLVLPSGCRVQRFGNVLRVSPPSPSSSCSVLDVPFRERRLFEPSSPRVDPSFPPPALSMERVLRLLDEKTLLRLAATCTALRVAATDPVLWMELFARRFGYLPPFSGACARDFWMGRFSFQCAEVAAFGTVDLPSAPPEDRTTRVVLLGPLRAGKTALLSVLPKETRPLTVNGQLVVQPSTFVRTSVFSGYIGGSATLASVKIWDLPGDPRNRSIASVYCSAAHSLVFVYDAGDPASFAQVKDWVLSVKMSVKTSQKKLALIARGQEASAEACEFARRERMVLLVVDVASDKGYEWRLFLWKLCSNNKSFV